MQQVEIIIYHDPIPWTSPKISRHVCYSAHSKFKEVFQAYISAQYRQQPIEGFVSLDMTFVFPYPKSTTKKKLDQISKNKIFPTKCDLTNLQKFAEDCLNKIVIEDDRNVVHITSKKLYGLNGCVKIKITPFQEGSGESDFRGS